MVWLWACLATAGVAIHHCGYDFDEITLKIPDFGKKLFGNKFFPEITLGSFTKNHDRHHEKFSGCYGALGLCDWLYGTYYLQLEEGWSKSHPKSGVEAENQAELSGEKPSQKSKSDGGLGKSEMAKKGA